jgi:hypothetical protein
VTDIEREKDINRVGQQISYLYSSRKPMTHLSVIHIFVIDFVTPIKIIRLIKLFKMKHIVKSVQVNFCRYVSCSLEIRVLFTCTLLYVIRWNQKNLEG